VTIDCDVLVIGSGAAGSVLAATLAEQTDLRIVLVERGGHFGREAMTRREWQMVQRLYADGGSRATDDGAIAVRGGECVGGGTTVNVALCLDPVPAVWEGWRRARGLDGFSFDRTASDHGVSGLNMAACLAEVRAQRFAQYAGETAYAQSLLENLLCHAQLVVGVARLPVVAGGSGR